MKGISTKLAVIIMTAVMAVTMLPSVLWADDAEYGYFPDEWSEEYYEEPQAYDAEETFDEYMQEEYVPEDYSQEAENAPADQAPGAETQAPAADIVEVSGYSGVYYYSDFQKAIDEAENDDRFRLISDVKLEKELVFNKDIRITLDLNGFNILISDKDDTRAYIRIEKGDITIKDSSQEHKSVIDSRETDHGPVVIIDDDNSDVLVNIEGGAFSTKNGVDFLRIEKDKDAAAMGMPDDPENIKIKISGGYFTEEPDAEYMEKGYEAVIVPDGYWEITESMEYFVEIDQPENDPSETDEHEIEPGMDSFDNGFVNDEIPDGDGREAGEPEFDNPEYDMSQVEYYSDQGIPEGDNTDTENTGGEPDNNEEQETLPEFETYPEETEPVEPEPEETEPEIVDLVAVSGVSGVYIYSDFQKAIDQAEEGDLFTLINNVKLTYTLVFNKDLDLTLDLNGFSIVADKGEYGNGSIRIEQGNITITDSSAEGTGLIDSTSTWEPAIVMLDNGWQNTYLTVDGGNFRAAEGIDCIGIETLDGQPGEFGGFVNIQINGGSFSKEIVIPEPETEPETEEETEPETEEETEPETEEETEPESEPETESETEPETEEETEPETEPEPVTYIITWNDWDGTELRQDEINEGELPDYGQELPVREEDEDFTYTFAGWSPEIIPAEDSAVYTAAYVSEEKIHTYTVTWLNWDGSVLKQEGIKEGKMPEYGEEIPVREEDEDNTYKFSGWFPEIIAAEADAAYTAEFIPEKKISTYTITWLNWDGSVLKQEGIKEGEMPEYGEEIPIHKEDEDYTYKFSGWSPEIIAAEADAEYTAEYTAEKKIHTYTITWLNWEGTLLGQDELTEGETPFYDGETPHRDDTDEYTYEFAGWDPKIVPAEADAVYTAVINENIRQYDLVWMPNGGTIESNAEYTKAGTVDAGQEIIAPEVHKDGYTLDGWFVEDEDGKEEWIFDEDVVDSDITLFAEWTEDPTEPPATKEPETTRVPETTEAPTTKVPETTKAPETTKVPETTEAPTTKVPETTVPPTTLAPETQTPAPAQTPDQWMDDAQAEVQGADVQDQVIDNVPAGDQPVYMDEIAVQDNVENIKTPDNRTPESGPAEPEAASVYVEEPTTPAPPYHDPIEYTTSRVASNAATADKKNTEKKTTEKVTTAAGSNTTVQSASETYQTTGRSGHNSMVIWIIVVAAALVGICILIVLLINRRGRR